MYLENCIIKGKIKNASYDRVATKTDASSKKHVGL